MNVDISELVQTAKDLATVQSEVDQLRDKAEDMLQPAIEAWFEDPDCGYHAGWTFDHLDQEGEYVVLVHRCLRAHGGLDTEYRTRVATHDLLGKLPAPKPTTDMVLVTSDVVERLRVALKEWEDGAGDTDVVATTVADAARALYLQVTA